MAASYAVVTGTLPTVVDEYTDFTSSGFGTPTAAILFRGNTNLTTNPSANARIAVGFWDGTNQRTMAVNDTDNAADSDTTSCSDDSYGMVHLINETSEGWFTVSNITDGIRITMSVEDTDIANSWHITVILLSGVNAKALTFTPNATQDATQESASLGFAPKLVLFLSIGRASADISAANINAQFSFGLAESGGVHRSIRWTSVDAAAAMDCRLKFDEDRCVGQENTWALEVTTWGSDTFTATTRDGASGSDVTFCLALGGADLLYDIGTLTTRTSTGDTAIATTNVPDTALLMLSTATSTTRHTDSGANGLMIGAGKGTVEYCHNISVEDGAATSNANSAYQAAQILDLDSSASGSRTDLCDATAVFNTSDVTLTYSVVDATARKGWYLIFGQPNVTLLVVQDATHGHLVESPALTQAHVLALADSIHGQSVENIALALALTLSLNDAVHAQTVDSVALTQASTVSLQDATHGQSVETVALTQAHILAIQEALHAQTAESLTIGAGVNLTLADSTHGQTSDTPTVSVAFILAVQDALHSQAAEAATLTTHITLIVSDALHTQLAGSATEITLPTGDRIVLVAAEDRLFLVTTEDRLFGV